MGERKKESKTMNNVAMHCDNENSSLKEMSILSTWLYITHIAPIKPNALVTTILNFSLRQT